MKAPFFYPLTLFFKVLWNKTIKFRNAFVEWVAVKMLFPLAGIIQRKSPGAITINMLLKMDKNSFGYALGRHMQRHKLEFIPGFEEHDMKHLLLGYEVTVPGEIRLSAFEFGAGNRSFMTLSVFLLGIPIAMDLWPEMIRDYREGRKFGHIRKFRLKNMLDMPLETVQKGITPDMR